MASQSVCFYDDPVDFPTRAHMEFRLVYAGDWLKSASQTKTRVWEKHALRKHFHHQLKTLWETHPVLRWYSMRGEIPVSIAEQMAHKYARAGVGIIPLVTKDNALVCELDVTFLRPGPAGMIIKHGGDIDNRLKVLFDALRMPEDGGEMKRRDGDEPEPNPLYCLLQDDSLVTKLSVTVDQLLLALDPPTENDICAIIRVTTRATNAFETPHELIV